MARKSPDIEALTSVIRVTDTIGEEIVAIVGRDALRGLRDDANARLAQIDPPASADRPDVGPARVRELYAELLEADEDGASSSDVGQIVDDWFVANGFPSIIYRDRKRKGGRRR